MVLPRNRAGDIGDSLAHEADSGTLRADRARVGLRYGWRD